MRVLGVLSVILLTCITAPGHSAEPDQFAELAAHISPAQLMQTVRELSNFDGRQSGMAGGQATAAYIARRFPPADRVRPALAKGAVASLTVPGPILSPYEERRGMTPRPMALYEGPAPAALPGLWITPAAADAILQSVGRSVRSFQEEMDR